MSEYKRFAFKFISLSVKPCGIGICSSVKISRIVFTCCFPNFNESSKSVRIFWSSALADSRQAKSM